MQLLPLAALASLAAAGAAPVTSDSPQGVKYQAVFSPNAHYNINGAVRFSAYNNGSVWVQVDVKNLPTDESDYFPYHVHVKPVVDGNCTATGGHLNPYNGSTTATNPADKEVGDLAGKHGNMEGTEFHTTYVDFFLSLNEADPAFVGNNRSVVIHDSENNRLSCADIVQVYEDGTGEHEAWNATSSVALTASTSSHSKASGKSSDHASGSGSAETASGSSHSASGSSKASSSSSSGAGSIKMGANIGAALTALGVVGLGAILL